MSLKSIASVAQNFACTISLNHRRFRFSNPTIPYVARDAARNMEYKPSRCAFSGSKAKTSGRYSRCGSKLVCAGFDVAIVSLSRRINPACRCTGVCGVFWSLVLEVERDSQGKKSRPRFSHSIFPGEPGGACRTDLSTAETPDLHNLFSFDGPDLSFLGHLVRL